jgi:hypothetical protein
MENSTNSSTINQKTENTRAGGPDDTRDAEARKQAELEEQDNAQRGTPEATPSN